MVTRGQFAAAFLKAIGAPQTIRNRRAVESWMQAESADAKFNPLACTQKMPGSTDFNWNGGIPVQNYVSLDQGVEATARTLNYGADHNLYGYKAIRRRLRGNSPAWLTLRALKRSSWGTGYLAGQCLPSVARHLEDYEHLSIGQ